MDIFFSRNAAMRAEYERGAGVGGGTGNRAGGWMCTGKSPHLETDNPKFRMLSLVAIAHACSGCGGVLTRVRAVFDRAYRAPVVICPQCARAVVRRRHPISAALRLGWRRAWAVWGLMWRGMIAFILLLGMALLCYGLLENLREAASAFTPSPHIWLAYAPMTARGSTLATWADG